MNNNRPYQCYYTVLNHYTYYYKNESKYHCKCYSKYHCENTIINIVTLVNTIVGSNYNVRFSNSINSWLSNTFKSMILKGLLTT